MFWLRKKTNTAALYNHESFPSGEEGRNPLTLAHVQVYIPGLPWIHLVRYHHLMLHLFSLSLSLRPSPPSPHAIQEAILCDIGEFHCHDEETCIPEAWLCDQEPDCPDDSDESDRLCKSLIPSIAH